MIFDFTEKLNSTSIPSILFVLALVCLYLSYFGSLKIPEIGKSGKIKALIAGMLLFVLSFGSLFLPEKWHDAWSDDNSFREFLLMTMEEVFQKNSSVKSSDEEIIGVAGKVARISAYASYGGGDILIWIDKEIEGCEGGFWMSTKDDGSEAMISLLNSALSQNDDVAVYAHKNWHWDGSADDYCRVYSVLRR